MPFTSTMSLREALAAGWPTKEDIERNRVFRDEELLRRITGILANHRYCLIEGAEKRGKTTLARLLGYQYQEDEVWDVRVVEVSLIRSKDEVEHVIRMIKEWDRDRYLVIVEDCHLTPDVGPDATENILDTAMSCNKACFVFTLRTLDARPLSSLGYGEQVETDDPFADTQIREEDLIVRLGTAIGKIENVVNVYIDSRGLRPTFKPDHRDYEYLVRCTGGNLRVLAYYLETWERECASIRLRQTDLKRVLAQFERERLSGLGRAQRDLLKRLSAIGQFELPVYSRGICSEAEYQNALEVLDTLEDKGLVFGKSDPVLLADTEARLTLQCLETNWRRYTFDWVKRYVRSDEAKNYARLLYCLGRPDNQWVLQRIVRDPDIIDILPARMNKGATLDELRVVLKATSSADNAKAARFLGQLDDQGLVDRIKNSRGKEMVPFLDVVEQVQLGKGKELRDRLSYAEYGYACLRSGAGYLGYLLNARYLTKLGENREWGKNMLRSLAALDLSELLRNPPRTAEKAVKDWSVLLHYCARLDRESTRMIACQIAKHLELQGVPRFLDELNGLIENMLSVAPDAANTLIKRVLCVDPSHMIEGCAAAQLGQFLWYALLTDEASTRNWAASIEVSAWKIIATESSPVDTFRLLLDLYQANRQVGHRLAREALPELVASATSGQEVKPEAVPLIGLLLFLGVGFDRELQLPHPREWLNALRTSLRIAKAIFSMFCVQQISAQPYPKFIKPVLQLPDISSHVALLIDRWPLPWTEESIEEILALYRADHIAQRPDRGVERPLLLILGTLAVRGHREQTILPLEWFEYALYPTPNWVPTHIFKSTMGAWQWLCWAINQNMFTIEQPPLPADDDSYILWRLMEAKIPEIRSGIVEVKAVAREAGSQSKVAVTARERGIDPVACCIGKQGRRIHSIVSQLHGEKVQVVQWDSDPVIFIANAFRPAHVLHVELQKDKNTAFVVVSERQLALAFGKQGRNARLAARLTGWHMYLKSVRARMPEAEVEPRWIQLNQRHPAIASSLARLRGLLVALKDAQGNKGCATNLQWDQAVSQRFTGKQLIDGSELVYWKRQLLWSGAVRADYLVDGEGEPHVAFSSDYENAVSRALLAT